MKFRQQIAQQPSTERWYVPEQKKGLESKSPGSIYLHSPQNLNPSTEAYHSNQPIPEFELQHLRFKAESEFIRNKLGRSAASKPAFLQEPREHRMHAINRTISPNSNMHFTQTNNYNFYYQNIPKKVQQNTNQISTPKLNSENQNSQLERMEKVDGVRNEQIFNYFDGVKEEFRKIQQLKLKNAQNQEANRQLQESLSIADKKIFDNGQIIRRLTNQIEEEKKSANQQLAMVRNNVEKKQKQLQELIIYNKNILTQFQQIKEENEKVKEQINRIELQNGELIAQLQRQQAFLDEQEQSAKIIDKIHAHIGGMEKQWSQKTFDLEKNVEELQSLVQQLEKEKAQQIFESEQKITFLKSQMSRDLLSKITEWEERMNQTKNQYEEHLNLLTETLRNKDSSLSQLAQQHASLNKEYAAIKSEKSNRSSQEINKMKKENEQLQTQLINKESIVNQLMITMKNNQKETGIKYKRQLEETINQYEEKILDIVQSQKTEREVRQASHQEVIQLMKEEWLEEKKIIQQRAQEEVKVVKKEMEILKQNSDIQQQQQLRQAYHFLLEKYSQYKKRSQALLSNLEQSQENLKRELRSLVNRHQSLMILSKADEKKIKQLKQQIQFAGDSELFSRLIDEMGGENEKLRSQNDKLREILNQNSIKIEVQETKNENIGFKFMRDRFEKLAQITFREMQVEADRLASLLSFQESKLLSILKLLSSLSQIKFPVRSETSIQYEQYKETKRNNRIFSTNTLPTKVDSLSAELECRDSTIKQLTFFIEEYKIMIEQMKEKIERGEQIRECYEQVLQIFGVKQNQHEELLKRIQSLTQNKNQPLTSEIKELVQVVSTLESQNTTLRKRTDKERGKVKQMQQLLMEANQTLLRQQLKTKNQSYKNE